MNPLKTLKNKAKLFIWTLAIYELQGQLLDWNYKLATKEITFHVWLCHTQIVESLIDKYQKKIDNEIKRPSKDVVS